MLKTTLEADETQGHSLASRTRTRTPATNSFGYKIREAYSDRTFPSYFCPIAETIRLEWLTDQTVNSRELVRSRHFYRFWQVADSLKIKA